MENILIGWKNFLTKSETTEIKARERAAVCAAWPNIREGKLLTFIHDCLTEIEGTYCAACGCPLSAKVRSNDICPENKW